MATGACGNTRGQLPWGNITRASPAPRNSIVVILGRDMPVRPPTGLSVALAPDAITLLTRYLTDAAQGLAQYFPAKYYHKAELTWGCTYASPGTVCTLLLPAIRLRLLFLRAICPPPTPLSTRRPAAIRVKRFKVSSLRCSTSKTEILPHRPKTRPDLEQPSAFDW